MIEHHQTLLTKWQRILEAASSIPSWTEALTLAYLAEMASKSSVVLECGTYVGKSAKVMLLAQPTLKLFCIDHFDLVFGIEQICRNFTLKRECDDGRCVLINGNSETGAKVLNESCLVLPGQADAIFIDDGHDYESLRRDIRCLLPFLKPGGLMVGHDYDEGSEVQQGVLSMLPAKEITVPVPRLWSYTKPV